MALALVSPTVATNTAFFVVFGIFVVAIVVLAVLVIMWAVRHDMAGWKVWRKEQEEAARTAGTLPADGRPARIRDRRRNTP
jgi:membrane protein YdbS with pleckstrin-like domain